MSVHRSVLICEDEDVIRRSLAELLCGEGYVVSPAANVAIMQGESVQFLGSATDLDADLPATYAWNFDEGAPNSNLQNPGSVVFEHDGTFEVQLVVTDSRGLVDPTPATVEVTKRVRM